jgi:hypothetical protein
MTNRPDRGGVGLWLFLFLLIAGAMAGFRIGQLYFDHETLKNEVAAFGDRGILDRSFDTKGQILKLFESYDVSLLPDLVSVEFNERHDRVTISFDYRRSANLLLFRPVLSFRIDEQRESAKASAVVQGFQGAVEDSNAAPARRYQQEVKNALGNQ